MVLCRSCCSIGKCCNAIASKVKAIKLKSESWILVYELFARELISENEFVGRLNVRKNLKMYQHLKKSGIHFIH